MSRAFTGNINSFNVSTTFTFHAADDQSRILAWLSPLEPQVRHQDIRNQRVGGVGNWLLETEEFERWYNGNGKDESDHAALFCHGNPGVGKSYITSVVVDYLCDQAIAIEHDMAVACFYYDFASRVEQSPTNMLGSLVKQILHGLETIPVGIKRKFHDQNKVIGGRGLQLPDIVDIFSDVSSSQRTFICVDALDECVLKHQREVLGALGEILKRSPNTRVFMTGRSHIRGAVEEKLGGRAASVSIRIRDEDKVTYLRERLKKDTTPEVMDSGLENDIMKTIPREISETFLLVALKVEAILRETTIHRRRKRLNTMGDGLGDAYETTLERIRAQDEEKAQLAMTALMWICHSERPLQVDELRHALAVEIGSTEFHHDNSPAADTLLACCQGLVTVDKEASAVRLIHHTLREYLSTHRNLAAGAHSSIAETCLTYLNSEQAKALSTEPQPDLSSMPFLNYCSRYWGVHANRELSDHAILLVMKFLDEHEKHIAAKLLFEQILDPDDSFDTGAPPQFSKLHCASFFGIVEVISTLLGANRCDINQSDSAGITALTWAVRGGHEGAVRLLLEQEAVDPEKPDNKGRTPLSWAVIKKHESMVKQLLDREDVNPDRPDNEGITPLSRAAYYGHESVVKLLLEQEGVDPERPDIDGVLPLSWAAIGGHESIVKQLLDREDVSPDRPDNRGKTALSRAAYNGHGSVVKLLLEREDVDPDKPDNEGNTALSRAAYNGHESVVKLLLEREDVNPDRPDDGGYTALFYSACNGHNLVVKQLLDCKDVNPDRPDNCGSTPLFFAAIGGHKSVVKQLLDREDVNPDKPNNEGGTPLSWAADNGHESVVMLLLDRRDVNPDKPNNKGSAALSRAAMKGHASVVKLLLDRRDVNPDRPDNEGNTPLSWAAMKGHELVVKQLLGRGDVNPDQPDDDEITPLLWAANEGHESVVKLLLDRGDVNPNKSNKKGNTALSAAAKKGHELVVKLLLDREDVSPDEPDNKGITPLSWAAMGGHERVVNQLLSRHGVDPDRPDHEDRTPFSWAAGEGREPIVKLLLGRQDVNPNRPDKQGHIPLIHASQNGHEGVVNLLKAWNLPTPIRSEVASLQYSLSSPSL